MRFSEWAAGQKLFVSTATWRTAEYAFFFYFEDNSVIYRTENVLPDLQHREQWPEAHKAESGKVCECCKCVVLCCAVKPFNLVKFCTHNMHAPTFRCRYNYRSISLHSTFPGNALNSSSISKTDSPKFTWWITEQSTVHLLQRFGLQLYSSALCWTHRSIAEWWW